MPEPRGIEREQLIDAIQRAAGSCVDAARGLGIGRATLYRQLERHGLDAGALRLVGGRYELIARLGQGGQARVYEVRDRAAGNARRALKVIAAGQQGSGLTLIQQEFRMLAMLRHRGLPRVHDFGLDPVTGRVFVAMDLIEGRPFLEALRGRRVVEIAAALVELLDVLHGLHRSGVVHRDVSSSNVLVCDSPQEGLRPRVFLVDLGLAQPVAAPRLPPAGKIAYVAPELIDGEAASARSDLYAAGVLGYLALAGCLPWPEASFAARSAVVEPVPLRGVLPNLDRTLERVLIKLVARDPAERFADAGTARDDLAGSALLRRAGRRRAEGVESVLVGRAPILTTVATWRRTPSAAPGLAILADVGVGKSRLLHAAVAQARADGVPVLVLSWRDRASSGLALLGRGLMSLQATLDIDQRERESIAQLAQQLSASQLNPSALIALESGAEILASACRSRGLLLVCDDLQNAEPALLDLLASWLRRGRGTSIRLLMAARPPSRGTPLDALLRAAEVEGICASLVLAPLDQSASQQLIEAHLNSASAAYWSPRLFELTGGNPLFLELVLDDLAGSDTVVGSTELPASIDAAAQDLLSRLDSPTRLWCEALAVAEGACRCQDVAAVSGVATADVDLGTASLVLYTEQERVDFHHPFLRTVQRAQLTTQRRRALHAAWVELCEHDDARLLERAVHLVGAGAGVEAVPVWVDAATLLEHRWEHQRTIPLLEASIDALEETDPTRLALLARIERACHRVRDEGRSLQFCRRWASAARAIGDRAAEARAVAMAAARHRERGELGQARALAMQADALAAESGSREVQALTAKILGTVLWMGWEHQEALKLFERVLESVDEEADPRAAALSYHDAAFVLYTGGQRERALELLHHAKRLFQAAGDDAWMLSVDNNLALLMASTGDVAAADQLLSGIVDQFRTMTRGLPVEAFLESRTFTLWRLGRYEELLHVCDELITEATRFSRTEPRVVGLLFRAEALRELDDRAAARQHVRLALELAEALAVPRQVAFARLARARDLREDGQTAAAEETATVIYQQAIAAPRLRVAALAAIELAQCALQRAAPRDALLHLERAEAALVVPREDASWRRVQLLALRAQARIAAGQRTAACADIEEGLGLAREHGPAAEHLSLLRLAVQTYSEGGESARTAAALHEGAATLGALASSIASATLRAQFLGRPDNAAMLAAARRSAGPDGAPPASRISPASIRGLVDIGRRAAAGEAIDPLLTRIVELAIEATGMERGALVLRTPGSDTLRVAASIGLETETTADALHLSQRVLDQARGGRAVVVRDARLDPELRDAPSVALLEIRSVVCLPLRAGDEVSGALYLDARRAEAVWCDQDLGFLEALSAQATLAIEYSRLVEQVRSERDLWRAAALPLDSLGEMLGGSSSMAEVFSLIKKVAPSPLSVVICGESGTGKELAAKAIHALSPRASRPFVAENVATLREFLAESQLFGHVRGAFTGAQESHKGLFAQADGGTLFLDEIADLHFGLQAKLLRVLQDGMFTPLGAHEPVQVDVRVVVATQRDLSDLVAEGRFRSDLYFRLNGVTLRLPPLRQRPEEIRRLVRHFLVKYGGVEPPTLTPKVMLRLAAYPWPGNVRELENTVRRLVLLAGDGPIDTAVLQLDRTFTTKPRSPFRAEPLPAGPTDQRRRQVAEALELCGGDRTAAAGMLQIGRATLYRWIKRLGIDGDGAANSPSQVD